MLAYAVEIKERYAMSNIDNKELLLAAIDDYSLYTPAQRKLLQVLVNLSVDGTIVTTAIALARNINTTKITIYTALELFKREGLIEIPESQGVKFTSCRLKQSKLNEILSHYIKKLELK